MNVDGAQTETMDEFLDGRLRILVLRGNGMSEVIRRETTDFMDCSQLLMWDSLIGIWQLGNGIIAAIGGMRFPAIEDEPKFVYAPWRQP